MKRDPAVLAASGAFCVAAVFGTAVAVRRDIPGEPLGFTTRLTVRRGLLVGWGAGVAAPWPMPLTAVMAARKATQSGTPMPGLVCAGLGIGCIAGTLAEPVTYRPRSWGADTRMAITANVLSSLALVAAGVRYARRQRSLHLTEQPPTAGPGRSV